MKSKTVFKAAAELALFEIAAEVVPAFQPTIEAEEALLEAGELQVQSIVGEEERLPPSVNLRADAPIPGDQGQVGDCAAWAVDYTLFGWYAEKYNMYPTGGLAPEDTYAHIARGHDNGSTLAQNAEILRDQGVLPQSKYPWSEADYTDTVTLQGSQTAARYKIAEFHEIPMIDSLKELAIKEQLASGRPVAIAFMVYPEFMQANANNYVIDNPIDGEQALGGHAVTIFGYDSEGVWIENSWGSGWGQNGWAKLTWDFVRDHVEEATTIEPLKPFHVHSTAAPEGQSLNSSAVSPADHALVGEQASWQARFNDTAAWQLRLQQLAQSGIADVLPGPIVVTDNSWRVGSDARKAKMLGHHTPALPGSRPHVQKLGKAIDLSSSHSSRY